MNAFQAVVLAAGAGARFGGRKLLAPWEGRPIVQAAVESALACEVDEVLVVLGCDEQAIRCALEPLADPRLRTVYAADWDGGISASLRCAVRSLPADSRGFALFLGDMPCVPVSVSDAVLNVLQTGAVAVRPTWNGLPGHPVGLSARLFSALQSLRGDMGAGSILRRSPDLVQLAVEDRGCVLDIDVPADLARF